MSKSSFPGTGNPRGRKRSPKKNMEMKIKTKQIFFFLNSLVYFSCLPFFQLTVGSLVKQGGSHVKPVGKTCSQTGLA